MQHDRIRQGLNLFLAVGQIIVAALVNLAITGPSIGAISDRYPTYVVPAGYAFTIWNLIFALSLGYAIWQCFPAQRANPLLRRIGWLTASAFAATSAWMLVFQQSLFLLSLAVMVWLLLSLIGVMVGIYHHSTKLSATERWLVYCNFSIFLGWITVATVANLGQVLSATGWKGWGLEAKGWAIIAVLTLGIIAALVTMRLQGNAPYALTVIWALIGLAVNQFSGAIVTHSSTVGAAAVGAILFIGLSLLTSLSRQDFSNKKHLQAPLQT